MSNTSGNTPSESFGVSETGTPPAEGNTVTSTGTSTASDDEPTPVSVPDAAVTLASAQSTSITVRDCIPIPSPIPGQSDRTYYTFSAQNDTPTNERDACRLEFQHVSLDPALVTLGATIGIYISNEYPTEVVTPDDSVLKPWDGKRVEIGPNVYAWSIMFYDIRTEEWASDFVELGLLTINTREPDALSLDGYVVIRWNGEF